ncbi:MAG TPA: DUF3011 domain-containing protein [Luteimonas sp.]|nr:DUF3011 domain-containing protein [Luteimonas sp.]
MRTVLVSRLLFAASLSLASAAFAAPQYAPYGNDSAYRNAQTIRCESTDGRNRQCPIEAYGGVRLVRQLSDAACIEGSTWGYDRGRVWVTQGCRAEFAIGGGYGNGNDRYDPYANGANSQVLRCESTDGRYRQCSGDARGGVRLVRQLSDARCVEGRTWGMNRMGVWVDNGCRAEFETGYRGNNGWGWGQSRPDDRYGQSSSGQSVRCESNDGRTNRCNLAVQGGVRLQRQLSDSQCQQGLNWGWDRGGIWVSGGCRGEFAVW